MGCTSSRQARLDQGWSGRSLPVLRRGFSFTPPIYYPSQRKDDSYHIVALTSSTLGSLKLDPLNSGGSVSDSDEPVGKPLNDENSRDFSSEVNQAKTWSEMIDHKTSKTPTITPTNEPETINASELMAGLEDLSPLSSPGGERAFSFHTPRKAREEAGFEFKPKLECGNCPLSNQPMRLQTKTGHSIISNLDPGTILNFQRALNKLSPEQPTQMQSKEPENCDSRNETPTPDRENGRHSTDFTGIVQARISAFQHRIDVKKTGSIATKCYKCPPGAGKVVFYCTSLRGVRKTYEDCCDVRVVLRGYGFRVDERDVSMDGGFREELNEILGEGYGGSKLPKVFANGRFLGGAEEIRLMHEVGKLTKALEGCETVVNSDGVGSNSCEGCSDVRFLPCETCSGSCKVYIEDGGEDEEQEAAGIGGFRRCPDCNENGLMRCPICCYS